MPRPAAGPRCPCHSRKRLRRCCGPLLAGRAAATPTALMRSRFAAYALGRTDYILATTHPDGGDLRGALTLAAEEREGVLHGDLDEVIPSELGRRCTLLGWPPTRRRGPSQKHCRASRRASAS